MSQHKEKVLSDHLAEQLRGVPNLTEPAELLARQRGESLKLQIVCLIEIWSELSEKEGV